MYYSNDEILSHINHLSALTTKLKNVEHIHNSEKFDRYSSETSSYLHRLASLSLYAHILLSNSVPINNILKLWGCTYETND
ncbi:unnamed protein product [Adineta ricciae]|uniref:Uncharacterized protein n=1 Tax=Adineta ricciae TaxID=249248 RepID=A0A813XKH9_ADIRI|nr:unnamed protein product [Adineta ricciae]